MAEWGVFAVSRGIWGDDDFAPEPYTEREAWLWLVSAAAWKQRRVFVGRSAAMIERGEFFFSLRFLETRWMWGKNRVSRFLKRLVNIGMILPVIRDTIKVYSIKNYNKFQIIGLPERDINGTPADTRTGHERDTNGTKKKQSKKVEQVERSSSLRSDGAREEPVTGSAPAKTSRRKTQIAEGVPSQADKAAAVKFWTEHGRTDLCATVTDEADQFRDRNLANGETALDWSAKWRTWYRNALKFNKREASNGQRKPTSTDQHLAGLASLVQDIRERRGAG